MKNNTLNKRRFTAIAVLCVVLVCFFLNCEKLRRLRIDDFTNPKIPIGTVAFSHIWKDPTLILGGQGNIPQQNRVIKNIAEWNAFLNSIDSVDRDVAQHLSKISIDFSTHQVLALFDKARGRQLWDIEIADITEYAYHIVVTYHTWKKRSSSGTQALHMVRIPATNKPILFEEEYDEFGNEPANVPRIVCWVRNDTIFLRGTAYLFIDSMPAGQKNINNIINIIYYTARDTTYFSARYPRSNTILYHPYILGINEYIGWVCNFPDFAKQWNIPPEGKQVFYRGELYPSWIQLYTQEGYLVLTNLKDTL